MPAINFDIKKIIKAGEIYMHNTGKSLQEISSLFNDLWNINLYLAEKYETVIPMYPQLRRYAGVGYN